MAIILKVNNVNLFVSSVLFVFWDHSPNFLDTTYKLVLVSVMPILRSIVSAQHLLDQRRREGGEAGTFHRGLIVLKAAWRPAMLHMILSYWVLSLSVDCTNK
jgi:hypothetical protein